MSSISNITERNARLIVARTSVRVDYVFGYMIIRKSNSPHPDTIRFGESYGMLAHIPNVWFTLPGKY